MKTPLLCLAGMMFIFCMSCRVFAQAPILVETPLDPGLNVYELSVEGLPDLPGEGAEYSFLWLFGDGEFSITTSKTVVHTYLKKTIPLYQATTTVYVSCRYSENGPPPIALSKVITTGGGVSDPMDAVHTGITLQTNHPLVQRIGNVGHSIIPGDVNACVLTYSNAVSNDRTVDGRLFFFYNEAGKPINDLLMNQHCFSEEEFYPVSSNAFDYPDQITSLLDSAFEQYSGVFYMDIKDLVPGEQRSVALVFQLAAEIPAVWGDFFSYYSIFIPADNVPDTHCIEQLEMVHLDVHDPNYLHVSRRQVKWKTDSRAQELVYTLYFENEGSDIAKKVRINMQVPPSLRTKSFKTLKTYPEASWKFTERGQELIWVGQAIHPDSNLNKGYIQFSMKTGGKREEMILSQAQVKMYGANTPVADSTNTNPAITGLLNYWRLGARAGIIVNQYSGMYGFQGSNQVRFPWPYASLGVTLMPYDPYYYFHHYEVSISTPVFFNASTLNYHTVAQLEVFPYKAGYHFRDSKLMISTGPAITMNLYARNQHNGSEQYSISQGQNASYQCWGGGVSAEASFPFILDDLRMELRYNLRYNTLVSGSADHWYYSVITGFQYTFGK